MADDVGNTGMFAQHYRTGKYADLTLVAKDGTHFNVHRLVVCPLSPVLDAQAADGAKCINTDEDATTIGQMIEWLYGIDNKKLLIDRKPIDEVKSMGSSVVCNEIITLSGLAKIADKYQLPKLKDQATELIDEFTKNLSSIGCILEAVLQLAPEGVLGNVQKTLILCASKAVQDRQADMIYHLHKLNKSRRPMPITSNIDASNAEQNEPAININRSALRSAKTPVRSSQADDEDSDVPLSQHSKKRRKQESHHYVEEIVTKVQPPMFAREMNLKYSPVRKSSGARPANTWTIDQKIEPPLPFRKNSQNLHIGQVVEFFSGPPDRDPDQHVREPHLPKKKPTIDWAEAEKIVPQSATSNPSLGQSKRAKVDTAQRTPPTLPSTSAAAGKLPQTRRRNEPFRMSTALPENIPAQGPHCHCKVADSI